MGIISDFLSPPVEQLTEQVLRHDEGLRLKPYKCTAGKLSIGVGRNLDDRGIRQAEAAFMLYNDIAECMEQASKLVKNFSSIDKVRQAAIISMIFQLGEAGFSKFISTRRNIDKRDWEAAAASAGASLWAKQTPQRALRVTEMLRTGKLHEAYK